MAKRKKFGVQFSGFEELAEKYNKLGGDLQDVVGKCLDFIPQEINPKLESAMAKHHRSGKTEESLAKDQHVEWEGTTGSIKVGFNIRKGGLASIFLMYGTAKHAPVNQYGTPKKPGARINPGLKADMQLYNAIYGTGTQREISAKQEKIFTQELDKIWAKR